MAHWSTLKNSSGCYGLSLLSSGAQDPKSQRSVRFNAIIEKNGRYEVYAYFPRVDGGSSQVTSIFHDGKKKHTK